MRKLTFVKNAAILTVTSFILRTLGVVLRVYLSNKIGAEGIGLYQIIFSVYVLASTFATAGVSTGVIRVITDELACGTKSSLLRALKKCLIFCLMLGIFSSIAIYLFSGFIARYCLNDYRTLPALKVIIFAFPFMSITSCIKGYFIALRRVIVPSNAQLFEQIIRIVMIYILIDAFIPYGIASACVAIMLGDVISEASSCIYSYVAYTRSKKKLCLPDFKTKYDTHTFKKFVSIAAPVALNRYLTTFLRTFENLLVPDCLMQYTSSREKSLEQFGMLRGMALPILFFPSSFLSSISTLLIPDMAEASILHHEEKAGKIVKRTLHITLTLSILVSCIFFMFADEFGLLIYKSKEIGFLLKVLAPLIPFMYLETVVMGILQGLNQQMSSLKYNIIDSIIRISLIYILVSHMGINGFIIIMILSNITTSVLNVFRLIKVTKIKFEWKKWLIKPLLCISFSVVILKTVSYVSFSNSIINLTFKCGIICFSYLFLLIILRTVTKDDLLLKN